MTRHINQLTTIVAVRSIIGTCLGGSALFTLALLPAQAQSVRPSPLQDLQTRDGGSDFFGGRENNGISGITNFIQNAIIGTPRSKEEFTADQKENFDDVTAQFRKRQAEQIRRQQPQSAPTLQIDPLPTNSVTNPSSN